MKKLKLLSLLLLSVIFVNCEKEEQKTYDGKALLTFASKTASVGVLLGAGSSDFEVIFGTLVEAPGAVVTLAPMPLLAGDASVPAVLGVDYTIATSSITLGGGLRHKFVVKFLESGATLAGKKVMFRISSPTIPVAIFNENVAITARLLCPVEATQFVGNYRIVETSPLVDGPTLSSGTIVAVSVIAGSPGGGGRTFRTAHYPLYCPGPMSFNFDLTCGRIVVRPNLGGLCNCSGPNVMGPATVSTTYVAGATDFTLRFTNDVGNTCGPAVQTTYSFTKQ